MEKIVRAIGLLSGGLDSALAVALLRKQGIDILGLHYLNGFSPGSLRGEINGRDRAERSLDEKIKGFRLSFGIPVEAVDVSEEYLDILLRPSHGFGANVNPCIDCRIFMLRDARERMDGGGFDFVFTGEVLGQRPMSQHRRAMSIVERESGLEGMLLRPLSAKLLPATKPEMEGLVNREELLDIQGRSRRRQIELAEDLGIDGYSQPAGGCILTDSNYARRFKDLMDHKERPSLSRDEAILLSAGRHLRLSPDIKIVVGREKAENDYIERSWSDGWLAVPVDHPGPTVLVQGEPTEDDLMTAATVAARYSDAKHLESVRVAVKRGGEEKIYTVAPAADEEIERYRI